MNRKTTGTKVESKTITMSYDNLEAAVIGFLYATRTIPESWDVTFTDIPLALNEDGFVEFEIEIAKPIQRNLRLVDEDFKPPIVQDNQIELPLEVFEKIHVKD